jgi:CxC2 like cysteine cluster associated with KDZ transposases
MCQVGVEIHLGHGGNACPTRRDWAGSIPTGTETQAGYRFDGTADIERNGGDVDDTGGDVDDIGGEWVDEDDEDDEDYGLPKLKGDDVCIVVDKSGVHRIRVRPCVCHGCPPMDLQCLDMGLFPASLRRIKTVFTFAVLDDFRMDNLECKTAGLNYYNKLRRLTSNEFPRSVPVCRLCFT